jgi:hypothetical protein
MMAFNEFKRVENRKAKLTLFQLLVTEVAENIRPRNINALGQN